jgi:PDZ domain-containing protein
MTLIAAVLLLLGLLVVGSRLRVPYVVLVPGPVTDTLGHVPADDTANGKPGGAVIQISGVATQPSSGHLYLTTVGLIPGNCSSNPTFWQTVKAWFNSHESVEPKAAQCPPGQSSDQVRQEGVDQMSRSQSDAVYAALTELGYKSTGDKVKIDSVASGVPASDLLQSGDLIESVNSKPVTSPQQIINVVRAMTPGQPVTLGINRAGTARTLSVKTTRGPDGKPRIGISLGTTPTFNGISVSIGIDPNVIGGPSAGTALALGIIDKLTPGDLTGGQFVAGTGEISPDGTVGPIGGIAEKMVGAHDAGARWFLAPTDNCNEVVGHVPDGLRVVRISTLHDARLAVQAIGAGGDAASRLPTCRVR